MLTPYSCRAIVERIRRITNSAALRFPTSELATSTKTGGLAQVFLRNLAAERLAQHLAAATGPLAIDVAMYVYQGLGVHDVQPLADLLAAAHRRVSTSGLHVVCRRGFEVEVFRT